MNLPPSPPKLPVIGNLHQLGTLPHRSFQALSVNHGPIVFLQLGNVPTIVVSSSEIAQEILKQHDIEFASRPQSRATQALLYGATDIAFAPYSEYWRQARKFCTTQLLCSKRVQSFKSLMEEEVKGLIDSIHKDEGSIINIGEMLVYWACNVLTRATMNKRFEDKVDGANFGELTKSVMELIGAFCIGDYFPSFGWLDHFTGFESRLKLTSKRLDAYFDEVIREHKDDQNSESDHGKKDFIDFLLCIHRDRGTLGIDFTLDNLKAIILDMFLAGTDTTSTTVEWAMTELVRNPSTMKKVQQEVRREIGSKLSIDKNDIVSMVYLKCVIKETLRLHPAAPLLAPRESPSTSTVKLSGYDIPPKTKVYINAWAIQMDPILWPEPDKFKPERFLDCNVDFTGNDFTLLPFGSGRRGCPGIQFGMVQVEIALANLLCWFNWKLPPDESIETMDMSETFGLVVHKTKPLHLVPQLYRL
ncbi:hypothetical protein ACFE04_017161 [Oxalis oulophora]